MGGETKAVKEAVGTTVGDGVAVAVTDGVAVVLGEADVTPVANVAGVACDAPLVGELVEVGGAWLVAAAPLELLVG